MKKVLSFILKFILIFIISLSAFASIDIDVDYFYSPDHTKVWTPPLSSGQFANQSSVDSKEDIIVATTSADYYGGDKLFHTLLSLPISTSTQTALNAKEDFVTATTNADYYGGDKAFHTLLSLPVSTATSTALNAKEDFVTATSNADYYGGDKAFHAISGLPVSTATSTALGLKENSITATSSADYYGGDKSFHPTLGLPIGTATQAALDLKAPLADSSLYRVGPGRQYTTIQSALNAIGPATDAASATSPKLVMIAGGVYDEDLVMPAGRIMTLVAEGTVILGNGLGSNWSSTNTRNVSADWNSADVFGATNRGGLTIMALPASDPTSTFIGHAGMFNISGNVTFTGAFTRSVNLSSVKIGGTINDASSGLTNLQAYRTLFVGAVNMGAVAILERCVECEFDALVTVNSFNSIINSEIKLGMTVTANSNTLPPSGIFNTTFFGTFTGPASSLKLDLNSDYFFRTNGASLGGSATKVLLASSSSATVTGPLSSTDWSTFNGKLSSFAKTRTYYVDKAGSDSTCLVGRIDLPCLTIQKAIDLAVALPSTFTSPALINVYPGQYTEDLSFTQQGISLKCESPLYHTDTCQLYGGITVNLSGTAGGGGFSAGNNNLSINGLEVFATGSKNALLFSGSALQRLYINQSFISQTTSNSANSALLMSNTGVGSTITARDTDWSNNSSTNAAVEVQAGRLFNNGSSLDLSNSSTARTALLINGSALAGPSVFIDHASITGLTSVTDNTAVLQYSLVAQSCGTASCITLPSSPSTGYFIGGDNSFTTSNTNVIAGSGIAALSGSNFCGSSGCAIVGTVTQAPLAQLPQGIIKPSGALISGLTASKLVVTDASKNLASATVTLITNSGSVDFASVIAGSSDDKTLTVTGAAVGDVVSCGKPSDQDANLAVECFVSATNTVTFRAHNVSLAATVDQASKTYKATVLH